MWAVLAFYPCGEFQPDGAGPTFWANEFDPIDLGEDDWLWAGLYFFP